MATTTKSTTARGLRSGKLAADLSVKELRVIRQAAARQGRSTQEFIRNSLKDAAQRALESPQVQALSARDSRIFADALLTPPPPDDALVNLFRRYGESQEIGSGSRAEGPGGESTRGRAALSS